MSFNTKSVETNEPIMLNLTGFELEESPEEILDVKDALIKSISLKGYVDMNYICTLSGLSLSDVIHGLGDAIFRNPELVSSNLCEGWETKEEYLSGNLYRKLEIAMLANRESLGAYKRNIKAIKEVLPEMLPTNEIYISLGSPWIPEWVIDDFLEHLFGKVDSRYLYYFGMDKGKPTYTRHDADTGMWEIRNRYLFNDSVTATEAYGTRRMDAIAILEKSLNMRTIVVRDTVKCSTTKSGKASVINKEETVAALEKQKRLKEEFARWVWTDSKRKKELERIYQEKYVGVRKRYFDGSFLTFPGMSKDVTLYPYQKDAVARILFSPNTLLAHDVGAGKTYVMVAAGMELKRMGISNKNLYVVPNNILGQWETIFKELYPKANLLVVDNKLFTKEKKEETLKKIKTKDYDAILMTYSCFDRIPLSKKYYMNSLKEEEKKLSKDQRTNAKFNKASELRRKISLLAVSEDLTKDVICFDELGITRLFVDEAHNYKNVPIDTNVSNVLGISSTGSKKCKDMLDKVRCVQRKNLGRGVVMATGTPITNSITDIYVMQMYLQSGELSLMDIANFDGWLGMFAEPETHFEIDVDTNSYRLATRFSKFHNLPELTTLIASIADFHALDLTNGIPLTDGYLDKLIPRTIEFSMFLKEISVRADKVRNRRVSRRLDNMLKITTDGRLAALDMRLVDKTANFTRVSKVYECAKNVIDIYNRTSDSRSTQLVFCDTSTPKDGFNIYDELKRILVGNAIPEDEVAYIHDATTEAKRQKLFSDVRSGKIRILIGSTFKLGLGVNVQDKLIALHHLDIPWRPADMVQREGRILRQGNENLKVEIYRYITEGSFDAYSWQLLETKQRFITDILSGHIKERHGNDVDDAVLNYAEVKALAIGNPLIKKRVETANELTRFITLQRKSAEKFERLSLEEEKLPAKIEKQRLLVLNCKEDAAYFEEYRKTHRLPLSKEEKNDLIAILAEALSSSDTEERQVLNYKGFDIVVPKYFDSKKAILKIVRKASYDLEIKESAKGALTRIENFLNLLSDKLLEYEKGLSNLERRLIDVKNEIANKEDYTASIEKARKKLSELDEEIGAKSA